MCSANTTLEVSDVINMRAVRRFKPGLRDVGAQKGDVGAQVFGQNKEPATVQSHLMTLNQADPDSEVLLLEPVWT